MRSSIAHRVLCLRTTTYSGIKTDIIWFLRRRHFSRKEIRHEEFYKENINKTFYSTFNLPSRDAQPWYYYNM